MDFIEWLKEYHGMTWEEYDRLNEYQQSLLVKLWKKWRDSK